MDGNGTAAEHRYQQALTSFEQLGNQTGIAGGHHQLGMLAQARADYPEAEHRYQQALTINEQLGNQAGIAATLSQLAILNTATGNPTTAITLHLQALTIRLTIGAPQAIIDISHLAELRTQHRDTFSQYARQHLEPDSYNTLVAILDNHDQARAGQ